MPGVPFTTVISYFKQHAPLTLAESWDNVGLLIEPMKLDVVKTVMLTNDLTEPVMKEAINVKADLIVAYHPPIFTPLKKITHNSWKERIVAKCLEHHIGVYSPHTCLDALHGGVNDWLIDPFVEINRRGVPIKQSTMDSYPQNYSHRVTISDLRSEELEERLVTALRNVNGCNIEKNSCYSMSDKLMSGKIEVLCNVASLTDVIKIYDDIEGNRPILQLTKLEKVPLPLHGMGREVHMKKTITIQEAVDRVKKHLGLSHVRLALANKHQLDTPISSVAVCAGSGASVLRGLSVNLCVTGEMSHHDVLDHIHYGRSVILCEHSNTERGFLKSWAKTIGDNFNGEVNIIVSQNDRDPLEMV